MLISKAMLAVRHAASTDETRYNLNGIHFRSDTEVEATDGHMLIRTRVPATEETEFPSSVAMEGEGYNTPEPIKPFVMQLATVEALRKAIPVKQRVYPILEHAQVDTQRTNANGKIHARVVDADHSEQEIQGHKIDGDYPSTDQVCTPISEQTEIFTLDLKLLERVLKAAKEFNADRHEHNVKGKTKVYRGAVAATFYLKSVEDQCAQMSPVTVVIKNKVDGGELEAVVMPMRK
jgi:hypothetical protein